MTKNGIREKLAEELNLLKYDRVIFDCDGVLLNSNEIKKMNIFNAAAKYVEEEIAQGFTSYFTSLNGVPRLKKALSFFSDDKTAKMIINEYNELNVNNLFDAELTTGAKSVIQLLELNNVSQSVVSGAEELELRTLLEAHQLLSYFDHILGGPRTKKDNFRKVDLTSKTIFIGDSRVDYEVASFYKLDFCFMYGYTQFEDWEGYFKHKNIFCIKDLMEVVV